MGRGAVREAPGVNSECQSSEAVEGRGPADVSACADALVPYQGQGQHPKLSPSAWPGLRAHGQNWPRSLLPTRLGGELSASDHPMVGPVCSSGGSCCPPRPPTLCPWLSPIAPYPRPHPLRLLCRLPGRLPSWAPGPSTGCPLGPLSGGPEHRIPLRHTSRETPGPLPAPDTPLQARWPHHRSSPAFLTSCLTTQSSHSGLGVLPDGPYWAPPRTLLTWSLKVHHPGGLPTSAWMPSPPMKSCSRPPTWHSWGVAPLLRGLS